MGIGALAAYVFFIVLTSILLQGTTLAKVAKWLNVDVTNRPGNNP